jgi:hypothetical protein
MNQYRCETCDYRSDRKRGIECPYDKEEVYYKLKEEMSFPRGAWLFTSVVGCASHSDFRSERDKVLEDHIEPYIERIRVSSKSLKHAPLRKIISVSLLIAAEHYEKLRQAGEP